MPTDISTTICTVNRNHAYINATIQSLQAESPTSLVVGSPDSHYLDTYRDNCLFRIIEMSEDEWRVICDWVLYRRATYNYWRCLVHSEPGARGNLIFEDDIRFAVNWRTRLLYTLDQLEDRFGDQFILALYAPHMFTFDTYIRGGNCKEYPLPEFYGCQGMYYPERQRDLYAAYICEHGIETYHTPHDLLLREYVTENNVRLFATTPSLVQHEGSDSTGLGFWHQAYTFAEHLPER